MSKPKTYEFDQPNRFKINCEAFPRIEPNTARRVRSTFKEQLPHIIPWIDKPFGTGNRLTDPHLDSCNITKNN